MERGSPGGEPGREVTVHNSMASTATTGPTGPSGSAGPGPVHDVPFFIAPLPPCAVLIAGVLLGDGWKRPAGESAAAQVTFSAEILLLQVHKSPSRFAIHCEVNVSDVICRTMARAWHGPSSLVASPRGFPPGCRSQSHREATHTDSVSDPAYRAAPAFC